MIGRRIMKDNQLGKTLVVLLVLAVLFAAIVSLAGCGRQSDEKKPAVGKQEQTTKTKPQEQGIASIRVTTRSEKSNEEAIAVALKIPQISGMKDAAIQKSLNNALAGPSLRLRDQTTQDAREYYRETRQTGDHFWKYEVAVDYVVHYKKNGILSLTIDNYQFTGGAHGGTERLPFNIDLKTGKFLALKDLFSPGFDYQRIIDEEVRKQIAQQKDIYFEGEEGFKGIGDNRTYYIIPGYVVVYFAQYEIAPYASGMPEFKIPVKKFGNSIDQRLIKS